MYRSSGPNQFISAFYSELQLNGTIRYMNAGHPNPLLFKKNGAVVPLRTGGPLLGAFPDPPNEYEVGQDVIATGDLLVCCTDGITEAMDPAGREYGFQRLEGVVRDNRRSDAHTVFDAILEDVDRFCDGRTQEDDRTLIVIRRGSAGD
jgi:sigma-B regulation protein RsbU (phosphoserine phosphatase)